MQLITTEERSIHPQTRYDLGSDNIWWSRLQTPFLPRQGWDICITMSHMLREEWAGRGIWPTQQPHWDQTQAAPLVQTHQDWGRWGLLQKRRALYRKFWPSLSSSISKLVFLKNIHRLQQNFLICQALEITWAELRGWETRCQHYPPAQYCVKTKKIPFRKLTWKGPAEVNTKEIQQQYAAGWPPLGIQSSPYSDCCSPHIQSR